MVKEPLKGSIYRRLLYFPHNRGGGGPQTKWEAFEEGNGEAGRRTATKMEGLWARVGLSDRAADKVLYNRNMEGAFCFFDATSLLVYLYSVRDRRYSPTSTA